jgi:hypothetical protein
VKQTIVAAVFALAAVAVLIVAFSGISADGSDKQPQPSRAPATKRDFTAAMRGAQSGDEITLPPGNYPATTVTARYTRPLTVHAKGATIAGLDFRGAANITIEGARFTGPVKVESVSGVNGPSSDITIENADMTGGCMTIVNGARNITLRDSHLHGCWTGVGGPGRANGTLRSSGIRIEGNTIERMRADGIQFGDWDHVTIADNVIRKIADPAGKIHNDAIQFTGGSRYVTIRGNRLGRSSAQLILVQDAIRPISHVKVIDNIARGAGGVAIQSQGARKAVYRGNVICGDDGGLWLRPGFDRGGPEVKPRDTVVRNNVISEFREWYGARARVDTGNRTGCSR